MMRLTRTKGGVTMKTILAVILMIIILLNPHLLVIAIWYPIGLVAYGMYKGFKGETTTQNKGVK